MKRPRQLLVGMMVVVSTTVPAGGSKLLQSNTGGNSPISEVRASNAPGVTTPAPEVPSLPFAIEARHLALLRPAAVKRKKRSRNATERKSGGHTRMSTATLGSARLPTTASVKVVRKARRPCLHNDRIQHRIRKHTAGNRPSQDRLTGRVSRLFQEDPLLQGVFLCLNFPKVSPFHLRKVINWVSSSGLLFYDWPDNRLRLLTPKQLMANV